MYIGGINQVRSQRQRVARRQAIWEKIDPVVLRTLRTLEVTSGSGPWLMFEANGVSLMKTTKPKHMRVDMTLKIQEVWAHP